MNQSVNREITKATSRAVWLNIGYQFVPALFALLFLHQCESYDQWMWVEIVITIFTALILMMIYRNKCFDFFIPVQKMKTKTFLSFVCLLALCQLLSLIMQFLMQMSIDVSWQQFFQLMGNTSEMTFSYVVFVAVIAPVFEEIVFRGMGLHRLSKHSHLLAILIGSILFGCAHHNVYTIPFAMMSGILFSYVYLNYSIYASMALHSFNNGVFAVGLSCIAQAVDGFAYAQWIILLVLSMIGVFILIAHRKEMIQYLQKNRIPAGGLSSVFHSKLFWAYFLLTMIGSSLTIFA